LFDGFSFYAHSKAWEQCTTTEIVNANTSALQVHLLIEKKQTCLILLRVVVTHSMENDVRKQQQQQRELVIELSKT
jgi:hypothetical protein